MKIREALRRLTDAIFFPDIPVCGCCGKELEDRKSGVGFCRDCGAEMEKRRLPAAATDRGVLLYACYLYGGSVRRIVHRYKFDSGKWLAPFLGEEMAKQAAQIAGPLDAVAFVPLHKKRRRQRGYDQAELLAKEVAKRSGFPLVYGLSRTISTKKQSTLKAGERKTNVCGAFVRRKETPETEIAGKHFLLIDDVAATGSTLAECARVLRESGAASVSALVYARSENQGEMADA